MKEKQLDFREEILKKHSKKHTRFLAEYIGGDEKKFVALISLFTGDDVRITQRAAWIVDACAEMHPSLAEPYLPLLIAQLNKPVHNAVKRNVLRLLQFRRIPEELQGRAVEACFRLLMSAKEPVAVKAFAMTVLFNISEEEPGLRKELRLVIEDLLPGGSPAIRSRGTKILKQLRKSDEQ